MNAKSRADGFEHEEEQDLQTVHDRRLLLRLVRYLRPYRGSVVIALLLIVAVSALGLVGPLLVRAAIDGALDPGASAADRSTLLTRIGLLWLAVLIATAGLHYVQLMVLQTTGQRVMLDLRRQLFAHLMRQDHQLFDRQPVGRLMTRLTSDIEALNELFTSGLVTVATDLFTLVAIMGVMLWLDWRLALLSFTVIPLLFGLALVFRSRVRRAFRRIRVRIARINSFLQEHIAGITLVQGFDQAKRRLARFDELNRQHTEAHLETVAAFAVFFPAVEVISTAAVVLLLWQGGQWVDTGAVTIGTLVAFVQYAQRFYRPISDLSEKFNILQGAMAASERVFALLDTPPSIVAPANPVAPGEQKAALIEFDDVHFAYVPLDVDDSADTVATPQPVLRGLQLTVQPGERVAIVGSTGAGKTTLISLLLRFYDVDSGVIRLDGTDIREFDPRALRKRMALVLQEPRLFSGTLRENLTLWDEDFDEERLQDAIHRVGLDRVIARLPNGLEEEVREGGGRLSTGERQLTAFARALAHDPAVLILDEATASVDTETESRIQVATTELMHGRTSLVIAHRLATVRNADRIAVLHHGRLVEQGTHQQLMEHGQLYRHLVEMQMGMNAMRRSARPVVDGTGG
ncbi:ABC transporter ATP-binding protein [bacterium]|nr:MAG: ABC transporter ATP-binding protein [bacterium]